MAGVSSTMTISAAVGLISANDAAAGVAVGVAVGVGRLVMGVFLLVSAVTIRLRIRVCRQAASALGNLAGGYGSSLPAQGVFDHLILEPVGVPGCGRLDLGDQPDRQFDLEARAVSESAAAADAASQQFHELAADRQSQTGAFLHVAAHHLYERIEYALPTLARDADPAVREQPSSSSPALLNLTK